MPLDPDARPLVDLLTATFPRVGTVPASEARRQLRETVAAARRDVEPEPVGSVADRTVPGPAGDIPVRVYRPEGGRPPADNLPVLVYFHGGGWVLGDLESHDGTCRALCNGAGCIVVSVDYRLAPEHPYPAAVDDAYAATAWVHDHAAELGADADRVAVGGDSAGGNLAAAVCLMARDRHAPRLTLQLLIYPALDPTMGSASHRENAEGYFLTAADTRWYWSQYLADPAQGDEPRASPPRADDLTGLPPALVITAECDPLRDEGEAFGQRLADAGVEATVTRYDGMFHGFFALVTMLAKANAANQEACTALRRAFTAQRGRDPVPARSRDSVPARSRDSVPARSRR